jgi:hypothetical protein
LLIQSVKPQRSFAQQATRKVQDSFLPDSLCSQPAVPFMQAPSDEKSGGVSLRFGA